jgi:tRNA(Arg) A34 adenosine deaminase TadA
MQTALRAAADSPNRVRQVGAVLVASDGAEISACNTFPAGVMDIDERHAGDGRFVWMEHAERRAIFEAARRGVATAGAHITSTFFPCIDCARAIVGGRHRLSRHAGARFRRSGLGRVVRTIASHLARRWRRDSDHRSLRLVTPI